MTLKGYRCIVHNGRLERFHRVVYMKLHGPIPDGYHVHHIDGDKHNNDPSNLVAVSPREHIRLHRGVVHPIVKVCECCGGEYEPTHRNRGRNLFCSAECAVNARSGEGHPGAVLNVSRVAEIRRRSAAGESYARLGLAFGVTAANVGRIVRRETWIDVEDVAA